MKKILIATMLLAVAGSSFAATTNKALVEGANAIATTDCPLLSAAVTATLSKGNIGNVSCNDVTANMGVAVGNTSGKGKIFSIGSSGGVVTTTDTAGAIAPTATDMTTQADAKSATAS